MRDRHIAQLEARLEKLIEGAFAHFFGKNIRTQDIALHLARAMENGLHTAKQGDPRPLAPDSYHIRVSSRTADHLRRQQSNLPASLSRHLVELAASAGYRLENTPIIQIEALDRLSDGAIEVFAQHLVSGNSPTGIIPRQLIPNPTDTPNNPQLVIGNRIVPLREPLLNIGRHLDNQIVLDDIHVSRHHAQLRLRFGSYTLFDVQSRSGILVNDNRITEHQLQSGDVIQIGETRLVYIEDDPATTTTTREMPPVAPQSEG